IQDAGIAEVADKATSSNEMPQNASLDLRSAVESVTKPPATDEPPAPPVLARRRPPSRSMVRRDTPQKTQSSPVPDAAAPPAGRILIELDRGWAHAYAGEQRLCETPCTLELPAGPHELRFVTGDGKVFMQRVIVKAGEVVRLVVPTS
ncbi:MAG: PEGA domain-containing protein, partial [Myxococcota bacterium]